MTVSEAQEYKSDVKATWCPGCGHHMVMNSIYKAFAELELLPENTAVISGIGCSSRAPYFVNTYGMHTLHGRAVPIAEGLQLVRPEVDVVVVGGDGDAYSIGGNHLAHAARRNFDVTYIVMDNSIYGLTKGQASPTSRTGFRSNTSPYGSVEGPVVPLTMALSYGATYVARGFAGNPKQLKELIKGAINHHGFSFINVFSPCVTYNKDITFKLIKSNAADVPEDHDVTDYAKALTLSIENEPYKYGLFYKAPEKPTVDDLLIDIDKTNTVEGDINSVMASVLAPYK
jgi:2-oxoglutarate ferredoxin oxidoreductase subunit beta